MARFLKVKTADGVLAMLKNIQPLPPERVSISSACGRRLASDISASEPVPHFARATMDGYAVRARDTFGASESMPAFWKSRVKCSWGKRPGSLWRPEGP